MTSLDRSGLQHVASFDGPGLMAWSADAQGGGLPNIPSLPALRMGAPEGAAMESAEPFSPWGDYGHLLPSGRRAGELTFATKSSQCVLHPAQHTAALKGTAC